MNFDLELFKQAIETETKELINFQHTLDEFIESVDDCYLNITGKNKYAEFIKEGGYKDDENTMRSFASTVLVKYGYLQGLKDGKKELLLDKEKFNSNRRAYLKKIENSSIKNKLKGN